MKKQRETKKWLWLPALAAAAVLGALLLGRGPAAPAGPELPPEQTLAVRPEESIALGQGLVIERIDRYSGIYMEDGSNDTVQDVMMLLLRNDSDRDLQLARIDVDCGGETAAFEVTNLPAGERAVLLEQGRRPYSGGTVGSVSARNVVFFEGPMGLEPERLELSGEAGVIRVTNLTDAEIPGPVCVYYKNSAADLFYGGITYRVTISEPLAAGEMRAIPAGHYDPTGCRFVMATCGG